jgi:hypothetical protein
MAADTFALYSLGTAIFSAWGYRMRRAGLIARVSEVIRGKASFHEY